MPKTNCMDTSLIQNFAVVVRYGSLSKAASVLGIAQPALGRQVQKLEQMCGCRLLYRHGRGVELTEQGNDLLERALPLIQGLDGIIASLDESVQALAGIVKLGLTPTVSEMVVIDLLDELQCKAPGIQLDIASGYSGYIHEWLINGRVDVAILHQARQSAHLLSDPVCELPLYLVSSPARHATDIAPFLDENGAFPVSRFHELCWVLSSDNHGLRRVVERAGAGAKLNIPYQTDSILITRRLVCAGRAHTILPLQAVGQEPEWARVILTPTDSDPPLRTGLSIATRSNQGVSQATRFVSRTLKRLLQQKVGAEH